MKKLMVFAFIWVCSSASAQEIIEKNHYQFGMLSDLNGRHGAVIGVSGSEDAVINRFTGLYRGYSTSAGIGFNAPVLWNLNLSGQTGKVYPIENTDVGLLLGYGTSLDINKMQDRDFNRSTLGVKGSAGLIYGDSEDLTTVVKSSIDMVLIGNDATRGGGFGALQFEGEAKVGSKKALLGGGVRWCPGYDGISETEVGVSGTYNISEQCSLTVAYSNRTRKEADVSGMSEKSLKQLKATFGVVF